MFKAHGLVDETRLVGAVIRESVWCVESHTKVLTVPTSKSSSAVSGALRLLLILIRALEEGVGIVRTNDYMCGK